MDEMPTETVQNLDSSETGRLIADCLTNPLILRELLEHFPNPELLDLSLVNRMWNYEARSVIKKRGNLMARLGCDSSYPCQQELEEFAEDLQQMNVIPYTGVYIIICPTDHTDRSVAFDSTFEAILALLPLKQLKVLLPDKGWYCKDCSALLMLKKLLQHFSGVLEHLELDVEEKRTKFFRKFVRNCSFPALKVLELHDHWETSKEAYTRYMKAFVSRAPNLQQLHVSGDIDLMVNVLEGSKATLMHHSTVYAPFDDIPEPIVHALILRSVVLKYPDPDFDFERFNRIAQVLFQASYQTISFMNIDAVFAVPLMCYGITFENIHHRLEMAIHNSQLELDNPRILSTVKNFDFTHIFPNVNEVQIIGRNPAPEFSPDHLNSIVEQADAILGEPLPDRGANINKLYLDSSNFSHATVSFYAEMFTNIKILEVAQVGGLETPFGSIWKHWVDLEQLENGFHQTVSILTASSVEYFLRKLQN